jgi:hypothetical protein
MTALGFIVGGFLFCVLGILGFYNWIIYSTTYPIVPILLAIGITLIGYGLNFRGFARSRADGRPGHSRPQWALVIVLDIVMIFWTVSVYASMSGQKAAETLASGLGGLPSVVVYSENSLAITAPGTKTERLPASGGGYRYRYSNLRLLLYSSGEYFLLPDGWKRGQSPALLLKSGDTVRFEFYSG